MTASQFVDLQNARVDSQRAVMEKIIVAGHCPFCEEYLAMYHQQPILMKNNRWILTPSQWPYEHTRVHLLAICRRHVEKLEDLTYQESAELIEILQWATRHFDVRGGMLGMRFGEPSFSGATVRHLHAQFIVPQQDDEHEPWNVALWAGKRRSP